MIIVVFDIGLPESLIRAKETVHRASRPAILVGNVLDGSDVLKSSQIQIEGKYHCYFELSVRHCNSVRSIFIEAIALAQQNKMYPPSSANSKRMNRCSSWILSFTAWIRRLFKRTPLLSCTTNSYRQSPPHNSAPAEWHELANRCRQARYYNRGEAAETGGGKEPRRARRDRINENGGERGGFESRNR